MSPDSPSKIKRLQALETGRRGEALALELARARGWQPFLGNARIAGCEADLVCMRTGAQGREGLLLEVKTTGDARTDRALRLGQAQQRRLWRMAEALCAQHDLASIEVAVVLVTLTPDREHAHWWPLEPF